MAKAVGGSLDKETLCNNIRKLDSFVRFVGLINEKGRLVAGGMAPGIKSLEDTKKDEMLFMELALRVRMRQEFDSELGPVRFALSYRDRVIVLSFPLKNEILLISAEKDLNFSKFPFDVLKTLEEYLGQ
jgi:hypothetical protein